MHYHTRRGIGIVLLALVSIMAGMVPVYAQDSGQGQDALPQLFPPTGPYAVGRTMIHRVDEARPELHTADESDVRELSITVWYPAEPAADAVFAPYMPLPMARFMEDVNGLAPPRLQVVRANAVMDAPLASDRDTYPVLIFDPGFSATPYQYSVMIEELASHGYVVFGMSHPYVTAITVYPDGRAIPALSSSKLEEIWVPLSALDGEFVGAWVPDTSFVVNQVTALNADDPNGLFTGRLEIDQFGMLGHSQGARTVSEVCFRDARCAAAINMDGSYSAEVELGFERPYMIMRADNGVEDFIGKFETGLEQLGAGYYVIMVPRTHHNSFMDTAFWVVWVLDEEPEGTGAAQIAVMDYRLYATAFFDKHLRGRDVPLLDGAAPDHPEVFFLDRSEPIPRPTDGVEPQIARTGASLGAIEPGAADVWAYEGQAGEVLNILLMADRPANGTTQEQRVQYDLLDTLLVVRAPDGSLLAVNDDMLSKLTNSELRRLELPADGTYRIEVRSWASQTGGGYTLLIEPQEQE